MRSSVPLHPRHRQKMFGVLWGRGGEPLNTALGTGQHRPSQQGCPAQVGIVLRLRSPGPEERSAGRVKAAAGFVCSPIWVVDPEWEEWERQDGIPARLDGRDTEFQLTPLLELT